MPRKYVWEIGLRNLRVAYEAAQLEQARAFLAECEFALAPDEHVLELDVDPELLQAIAEFDLLRT